MWYTVCNMLVTDTHQPLCYNLCYKVCNLCVYMTHACGCRGTALVVASTVGCRLVARCVESYVGLCDVRVRVLSIMENSLITDSPLIDLSHTISVVISTSWFLRKSQARNHDFCRTLKGQKSWKKRVDFLWQPVWHHDHNIESHRYSCTAVAFDITYQIYHLFICMIFMISTDPSAWDDVLSRRLSCWPTWGSPLRLLTTASASV